MDDDDDDEWSASTVSARAEMNANFFKYHFFRLLKL